MATETETALVESIEESLEVTQQKEEYLVDKYTEVLEILKTKYTELERMLEESEEGSFEQEVLKGVLAHLREAMTENDLHLSNARLALWKMDDNVDAEVEIVHNEKAEWEVRATGQR